MAARKNTRPRRAHLSRSTRRRAERDERICLNLLGIRAAISVVAQVLCNEADMSMHLHRHALLPLNGVIEALGGKS